ncbi:MAG: hypothetical protein LBI62_06650 [Candidatus Accumulibacter sp.]|nr:hypothetical protein [Accumulibacter sp.]
MQQIFRRRHTDDFKVQAISLAESIGQAKAARQIGGAATNCGEESSVLSMASSQGRKNQNLEGRCPGRNTPAGE